MTSFSFTLYILGTLLQSVFCSTCLKTYCRNAKSCQEVSEDCGGESKCLTLSEHYEVNGVLFPTFVKQCAKDLPCDTNPSVSMADGNIRVTVKCCDGDDCNNDNYEIINPNMEPNGKVCMACLVEGTLNGCTSKEKVVCKGEETLCMIYIGTVENPDSRVVNYSARGCITPGACTYSFSILPGVKELHRKTFTCE